MRESLLKGRSCCLLLLMLGSSSAWLEAAEPNSVVTGAQGSVEVAPVWSGHPVGFALLTHGEHQFVAYYDEHRRMTVAHRLLNEPVWERQILPQEVGWDSHNSIVLILDDDGLLHLSGNMHVAPLVYYRTREPLDIGSFERIEKMVGSEEARVTYPKFFRGPKGELVFTYRDGKSGDGNQIFNVYQPGDRTWGRLLDRPLLDGGGVRNAYFAGPELGPDGSYHLCWVWRESPDCATNHDLSYARSKDLVHWETSLGRELELPMTLENSEIVDPVPVGGGIINGNTKVGFDSSRRVILSYHKYDSEGNTQIYNARLEDGTWEIHQASDWDWRWNFSGGGSIPFEIGLSSVHPTKEGLLVQSYSHSQYGSGGWVLDEETLNPTDEWNPAPKHPASLSKPQSDFPGMRVRWSDDLGESPTAEVRYSLRWETLGPNRDRPREGNPPPPTMLRVVEIRN